MNPDTRITELLELPDQPVAIKFQDTPPADVPRVDQTAPAGCTYWKYAAQGHTFYTVSADHYGCPVGAYTHGVDLPEEKAQELQGLVTTMVQLEYLDAEEVPGIPKREEPFAIAVYAPLSEASFVPDVVLMHGNARQMMLLAEAAHKAGIAGDQSLVGRPTCAAIPAVMQSGRAVANLGCIGNRIYTELEDDQMYFAIPGDCLTIVAEKLATIVHANRQLEQFHRGRC